MADASVGVTGERDGLEEHDESGDGQLLFEHDALTPTVGTLLDRLDLGDWIGAEGELITSRRGELILVPLLRPEGGA